MKMYDGLFLEVSLSFQEDIRLKVLRPKAFGPDALGLEVLKPEFLEQEVSRLEVIGLFQNFSILGLFEGNP